jgi:hypothetical protein
VIGAPNRRAAWPPVLYAARSAPDGGTLADDLGFDDAWIAKCLAASKKQEQTVPSVTGKVYNHSKRMRRSAPCSMAWLGTAADYR